MTNYIVNNNRNTEIWTAQDLKDHYNQFHVLKARDIKEVIHYMERTGWKICRVGVK